ncbi:cysteine rich repeat-containing protein, partial [Bradyrhizobium sp. NAS96.2]|uniref:cysteine rich repeat-containing protein n=1 Tax=Bradyrhizobium sp. NAS96.2 TaxID=1680160 RepID=UPI00093E7FCC
MINALIRATKLSAWLALAAFVSTAPALSQAPTQAQRDAIKSQCRNDYIAHCSSVPPGGEASLQCLQKNTASLGPGCASAVKAVEAPAAAPAAAKTEAAPAAKPDAAAATTAKPATEAAAPKAAGAPSSAQISAIRSACRSDYPKVCAGVPTGGAPALQCLEKNKAKLSPACEKAVAAAGGGGAA